MEMKMTYFEIIQATERSRTFCFETFLSLQVCSLESVRADEEVENLYVPHAHSVKCTEHFPKSPCPVPSIRTSDILPCCLSSDPQIPTLQSPQHLRSTVQRLAPVGSVLLRAQTESCVINSYD